MDLEGLHSFVTIAREKSISKAAQFLYVTQPTLSMRLKRLEGGLGVTLINRSWDGIKLTKHGSYFLPFAIQLLQDLSNATTVIKDDNNNGYKSSYVEVTKENRLHIGVDTWLAPLLSTPILKALNDNQLKFDYKFISRPTKTLLEIMSSGGVDLAVYYHNEIKSQKHSILLSEDTAVLLCNSLSFKDLKEDLSNVEILKDEPFLLFDNPILVYFRNVSKQIIPLLGIEPKRFHIVDDINIMVNMVANGNGYTVIPISSVYSLMNSSLPIRFIPMGDKLPLPPIHIAYSNSRTLSVPIESIVSSLNSFLARKNF